MRRLAPLLLAVLLPGCGHRGDPRPPLRRTPPAPQEFRLAQRGDALELRALAPAASVDGVAFEALAVEFLLAEGSKDLEKAGRRHRRPRPLPEAASSRPCRCPRPAPRCGRRPEPSRAARRGPGRSSSRWSSRRRSRRRASSRSRSPRTGSPCPGAEPARRRPRRPPVPPRPEPPAARRLCPRRPPRRPARRGHGPVVEGPRKSGFFVYRRVGSEVYGAPLVEEPIERRSLRDTGVPAGVDSVLRRPGGRLHRPPGGERALQRGLRGGARHRRTRRPGRPRRAAPRGRARGPLEPLRRGRPRRVTGSTARWPTVSRRGSRRSRLARTSWLDAAARPGVVYRYTVTALDRAGNESPPTDPVEASLP